MQQNEKIADLEQDSKIATQDDKIATQDDKVTKRSDEIAKQDAKKFGKLNPQIEELEGRV